MQSVRLHVAGDGVVWRCRNVALAARLPSTSWRTLSHRGSHASGVAGLMDMTGATIEAVATADHGRARVQ
jgi:hypothetical protein